MAFNVFYAWQSDLRSNVCRGMIRKALDEAKSQLENDPKLHDAIPDGILIDQDTQDVSGSLQIAETILAKTRECQVFVADLTPTYKASNKRTAPNPNVLLEYGYALHALSENRLVGVFNEAYGSTEDLPFDFRHRRWPIRYRTHEDDSPESRRTARQELARRLSVAIRSIIHDSSEHESFERGKLLSDPLIFVVREHC